MAWNCTSHRLHLANKNNMKDYKFKISGQDYTASVEELENGNLSVTVNGKTYQVELPEKTHHPAHNIVRPASIAGQQTSAVARPAAAAPGNVVAPLPGTITCVKVAAGQKVKKGDVLMVMEAMKMANDITAEADGTVKNVCVSQGQSVSQGMTLVEFVADAPAAGATPAPAPVAAPAATPNPATGSNCVTAPIPGSVTQVLVKVGDTVKAGDTVVMLEAMKMENSITAEANGTVKAVRVEKGCQVQSGEVLIELA